MRLQEVTTLCYYLKCSARGGSRHLVLCSFLRGKLMKVREHWCYSSACLFLSLCSMLVTNDNSLVYKLLYFPFARVVTQMHSTIPFFMPMKSHKHSIVCFPGIYCIKTGSRWILTSCFSYLTSIEIPPCQQGSIQFILFSICVVSIGTYNSFHHVLMDVC